MLKNLPSTPDAILAMEWKDYKTHFKALQSTDLTSENVNDWLLGWSDLADRLDEQYTRLFVATTQFTEDNEIEKRFNHFVEAIQPQARTEEQKLKEKILASGLQPANFKTDIRFAGVQSITTFR